MKLVKHRIEAEEVSTFFYPMLVEDRDGDVWFCPTEDRVYFVCGDILGSPDWTENVSFEEIVRLYGPLHMFTGEVIMSNDE